MVGKAINLYIGIERSRRYDHTADMYLRGTVAKETGKAVQINVDGVTCWFPKKALVPQRDDPANFTLARWFQPDGYAAQFIEMHKRLW